MPNRRFPGSQPDMDLANERAASRVAYKRRQLSSRFDIADDRARKRVRDRASRVGADFTDKDDAIRIGKLNKPGLYKPPVARISNNSTGKSNGSTVNQRPKPKATVRPPVGVTPIPATPPAPPPNPFEGIRTTGIAGIQAIYDALGQQLGTANAGMLSSIDELKKRIAGYYDTADAATKTNSDTSKAALEDFAKKMGVESALAGKGMVDWQGDLVRNQGFNASDKAVNLSTVDTLGTMGGLIAKLREGLPKGASAARQTELLSNISGIEAQAELDRQKALLEAQRQAAARRSSGYRRSGNGSSGSRSRSTLTDTDTATATTKAENQELENFILQGGPYAEIVKAGLLSNDPVGGRILESYTNLGNMGLGGRVRPGSSANAAENTSSRNRTLASEAANTYAMLSGLYGGPVTNRQLKNNSANKTTTRR